MKFFVAILFSLQLIFISCSVHLDIIVDEHGGAAVTYVSSMGTAVEKTMKTAAGLKNGSLFDVPQMTGQLNTAGFSHVFVSNPTSTTLHIQAYINDLVRGLPSVPGALVYRSTRPGSGILNFVLTPQILRQAEDILSEKEKSILTCLWLPFLPEKQCLKTSIFNYWRPYTGRALLMN